MDPLYPQSRLPSNPLQRPNFALNQRRSPPLFTRWGKAETVQNLSRLSAAPESGAAPVARIRQLTT